MATSNKPYLQTVHVRLSLFIMILAYAAPSACTLMLYINFLKCYFVVEFRCYMVEQSHQDAFEDSRMSVGCGCRQRIDTTYTMHPRHVHTSTPDMTSVTFWRDGRTYTTHIHTNVRRDRGPHCTCVFQIKLLDTIKAFA